MDEKKKKKEEKSFLASHLMYDIKMNFSKINDLLKTNPYSQKKDSKNQQLALLENRSNGGSSSNPVPSNSQRPSGGARLLPISGRHSIEKKVSHDKSHAEKDLGIDDDSALNLNKELNEEDNFSEEENEEDEDDESNPITTNFTEMTNLKPNTPMMNLIKHVPKQTSEDNYFPMNFEGYDQKSQQSDEDGAREVMSGLKNELLSPLQTIMSSKTQQPKVDFVSSKSPKFSDINVFTDTQFPKISQKSIRSRSKSSKSLRSPIESFRERIAPANAVLKQESRISHPLTGGSLHFNESSQFNNKSSSSKLINRNKESNFETDLFKEIDEAEDQHSPQGHSEAQYRLLTIEDDHPSESNETVIKQPYAQPIFYEKPLAQAIDKLNERIRDNSGASLPKCPDLNTSVGFDAQEKVKTIFDISAKTSQRRVNSKGTEEKLNLLSAREMNFKEEGSDKGIWGNTQTNEQIHDRSNDKPDSELISDELEEVFPIEEDRINFEKEEDDEFELDQPLFVAEEKPHSPANVYFDSPSKEAIKSSSDYIGGDQRQLKSFFANILS